MVVPLAPGLGQNGGVSVQSWQVACPRCGWANSGANEQCAKCGQRLGRPTGLLVAGQSSSQNLPGAVAAAQILQPGGFFPRLIAYIIDTLILTAVNIVVTALWAQFQAHSSVVNPVELLAGARQNPNVLYLAVALAVIGMVYFIAAWSLLNATPGMALMSLRIVDSDGRGIGFGRALARYIGLLVAFFLSGLTFGVFALVNCLLMGVTKDKRGIQDRLAGTYVIQFMHAEKVLALNAPQQPVVEATQQVYSPPPAPRAAAPVVAAQAPVVEAPVPPAMAPAASAPAPVPASDWPQPGAPVLPPPAPLPPVIPSSPPVAEPMVTPPPPPHAAPSPMPLGPMPEAPPPPPPPMPPAAPPLNPYPVPFALAPTDTSTLLPPGPPAVQPRPEPPPLPPDETLVMPAPASDETFVMPPPPPFIDPATAPQLPMPPPPKPSEQPPAEPPPPGPAPGNAG